VGSPGAWARPALRRCVSDTVLAGVGVDPQHRRVLDLSQRRAVSNFVGAVSLCGGRALSAGGPILLRRLASRAHGLRFDEQPRPYRSAVEMQEPRSGRHQRGQPEIAPRWQGFDHLWTRVRDLRSTRRRNLGRRTRGADTSPSRRKSMRRSATCRSACGQTQRRDGWRTCQRCGVARPWAPR
jgi:hypothetical protein